MALPYDATPPPEDTLPPALDQPLDDYPAVPPHVQSLMSRMSSSKVYLVDESPPSSTSTAMHVSAWLDGVASESGVAVKGNALYLSSELIQHLSTSKIFSWATGLGAQPMGIEWINDTTLHILFPSPRLAILALALLAKTGFTLPSPQEQEQEQEQEQGDDPLQERSAHPFPLSLLPRKPVAPPAEEGGEIEPETEAITKRGRGQFTLPNRPSHSPRTHDTEDLLETIPLEDGINPLARIALRLALIDDMTVRQGGKESTWYKKHGFQAGKETLGGGARRPFGPRDRGERGGGGRWEKGSLFSLVGEGEGGGEELAKRLGRERRKPKPYDRPTGSGRERGLVTQEELDRELESLRSGTVRPAEGGMDIDDGQDRDSYPDVPRRKGRGFRNTRGGDGSRGKGRVGKDDLDRELDEMFANRGD
ncbi:hypothetical protein D1P53_000966 [Cryptococcus gattii VGV]|nr:hypothetical protein D1P53_000966 [Cryptococcus gattii VGV]